ncbi:glycosyltransferase family 4 protein [Gracilimonas tropica]|uniref:glycosyltransferase family 4 protein n=1 Tax=Gracilimonas tropica TaxID=454600 RepID=UPI00035EA0E3|nr:glycosyltransferase family 4 protein [Gracilimonas tropica]
MPGNPTILFIHFGESSFVKEDLRILESFGEVRVFHFQASKSGFSLLKNFVQQVFWLLNNTPDADLIYCWFSDYHSFLPTVFSKWLGIPSITVLGGFDCNKIESLNYGIFCSSWRAPLGKYVLKNSSLLLPVDKTLIKTDAIAKHWGESHPNGVTQNIPGFNKNNWEALATGYDPKAWKPGSLQREKIVSTVALCSNHRTALIKGWDLFIEASKLLPDYTFKIVGADPQLVPELKERYQPGKNLEFLPPIPRQELENIYRQSSVYAQLSRAEGLPNVLCEAMMCGCVPVGSAVFGIPHGIGKAGLIAENPDPDKIAELIREAHHNAEELRPKARQRIIEEFSLENRTTRLQTIISEAAEL